MSKKNFDIAFKLGAKMDPSMQKAFGNAQKQLGGMKKGISTVMKTGAKLAAGAVAAGTAAFAATKKVTEGFDDIAKSSKKAGVSTDAYQVMDYWAGQNGISHNNMEKAVGRLNQRIGLAADGNDKYSRALNTLGVNMDDVRSGTISTEDAMAQAIKSLSEMGNEQEKSAMASELFGTKLGRELMPALQDGSLSLEDATKKAKELGMVIDNDTLSAAEEFNDTWDDLTRSLGAFAQKGIAKLMPFFQNVMEFAIEKMPIVQEKISTAMDIAGEYIRKAFEKAQPAINWIAETGIPLFMSGMDKAIEIVENLWEAAKNIYNFIRDNWSLIGPIIAGITGALVAYKAISIIVGTVIAIKTAAVTAFGAAMAFVTSPIGIVVLAIGALIAIGIALYQNWDVVKEKILSAWESIKSGASVVGETISGAFSTAYNAVTGLFGGIASWFGGIWDGVTGTLKGAVNTMISIANSAINGLNKISIKTPDWLPGKLGGKSFGFNIPNIPMLAKGGIVTKPTLAMVGEGAESEAVLPISRLKEFIGETKTVTTNNQSSNDAVQYVYAPVYNIPEGANKNDIEKASSMSFEQFERWIKKYEKDKDRKKF